LEIDCLFRGLLLSSRNFEKTAVMTELLHSRSTFGEVCAQFATRTGMRMSTISASSQTGQPSHPVGSESDSTFIRDRAGHHGVPKRPPGTSPGHTMHQQGSLRRHPTTGLNPALYPIIPLFAMVTAAFLAAGWAIHRQAVRHPQGMPTKSRRKEIAELEEPELVSAQGKEYMQHNGLRDFVLADNAFMRGWRGLFMLPSELPGDKSAIQSDRPRLGGSSQ